LSSSEEVTPSPAASLPTILSSDDDSAGQRTRQRADIDALISVSVIYEVTDAAFKLIFVVRIRFVKTAEYPRRAFLMISCKMKLFLMDLS
jgi:hypothetical protein